MHNQVLTTQEVINFLCNWVNNIIKFSFFQMKKRWIILGYAIFVHNCAKLLITSLYLSSISRCFFSFYTHIFMLFVLISWRSHNSEILAEQLSLKLWKKKTVKRTCFLDDTWLKKIFSMFVRLLQLYWCRLQWLIAAIYSCK